MLDSIELDDLSGDGVDGEGTGANLEVRDLSYPVVRRRKVKSRFSIALKRRRSLEEKAKEEKDEREKEMGDAGGEGAVLLLRHVNLSVHAGDKVCLYVAPGNRETCAALLDIVAGLRKERNYVGSVKVGDDSTPLISNGGGGGGQEKGRRIAYVKDRGALIAGTVKDNLRLCNLDATDAQLCEAARLACLVGGGSGSQRGGRGGNRGGAGGGFDHKNDGDDEGHATGNATGNGGGGEEDSNGAAVWSELTEILNQEVGDNGSYLDASERQRLCLARAIVTNPDVLLLEDPTHWQADDAAMSERIMRNVSRLPCTVIFSTSQPRFVEFATHFCSFTGDGQLEPLQARGEDAYQVLLKRVKKAGGAMSPTQQRRKMVTSMALRKMYPKLSDVARVVEQEQTVGSEVIGGIKRRILRELSGRGINGAGGAAGGGAGGSSRGLRRRKGSGRGIGKSPQRRTSSIGLVGGGGGGAFGGDTTSEGDGDDRFVYDSPMHREGKVDGAFGGDIELSVVPNPAFQSSRKEGGERHVSNDL
jgi:predicted ABC-type transport system involved in lysophospholipase L1 biosynthesis ATPase subunit